MKVAMYYHNHDVRMEEIPRPEIGPGEMLVKVMASGICGSDVMEWYRRQRAPLVLGHEMCGEIVEIGSRVSTFHPGQRVFISHHVPCNTCRFCLKGHHTACATLHRTNFDPGGFSEYVRIPELNVDRGVYVLPDEVSFEEGTFIEPLACVFRGQRLAGIEAGDAVLVIGAGISGLLHIQLARALGAGRVVATDIQEYRLQAALRFGADEVIAAGEDLAQKFRQLNEHHLADLVIICAGVEAVIQPALQAVDNGGTLLFFAVPPSGVKVPLPIPDLWRREITIKTSYGAAPADLMTALELIKSRRLPHLSEMITHQLSLDEAGSGFRLVADAQESIKVIIKPFQS
jgi:L-iditol 2-dehydrogenase